MTNKKKQKDEFEDLENLDFLTEEDAKNDDISEEINLDDPSFSDDLWNDYAEDLEFEE